MLKAAALLPKPLQEFFTTKGLMKKTGT